MIRRELEHDMWRILGESITEYRCPSCASYNVSASESHQIDVTVVDRVTCEDCSEIHNPTLCLVRTFKNKDIEEVGRVNAE